MWDVYVFTRRGGDYLPVCSMLVEKEVFRMTSQFPAPPRQAAIALDAWYQRACWSRFGHYQLAWWEQGQGEPLVLLHGFPTAAWDWQYVWEPLAQHFRVITLDLLGFGRSEKPWPHRYTIFEQADLVQALIQSLGIHHFHVLAHDYGVTVAQELLARNNDTPKGQGFLQSMCLLNGGLFPETHKPVLMQRLLASPIGPLLSRLFDRKALARSFNNIFGAQTPPSQEELNGFWALINHDQGTRVFPGLIRYMRERRQNRERWVGALQRASIPLKLINGNADPVSGIHMARRYQELIPGADITHLPAIGHYPQVEAPGKVLDAYIEFHERRVRGGPAE